MPWSSLSLRTRELRAERVELRSDGAVDQVITELDLRAADERLVHGEGRLERVTGALLQPFDERAPLAIVERDGGRDPRLHDARATVDEIAVRARDVGQERDAI